MQSKVYDPWGKLIPNIKSEVKSEILKNKSKGESSIGKNLKPILNLCK